jgi:hypothetical protein
MFVSIGAQDPIHDFMGVSLGFIEEVNGEMRRERIIVILVDDESSIGSEDMPESPEWERFA